MSFLGGNIFGLRKEFGVEEKGVVGMDRVLQNLHVDI